MVQHHPSGAGQRVRPGAGESQALRREGGPQGGQIAPGVVDAGQEAGGGRGAELDLSAGFEREARTGGERGTVGAAEGQRLQCGVDQFGPYGPGGTSIVVDEPLDLDTHQSRRSDLEADARHVAARPRFGQRGHPRRGWWRALTVGRSGA